MLFVSSSVAFAFPCLLNTLFYAGRSQLGHGRRRGLLAVSTRQGSNNILLWPTPISTTCTYTNIPRASPS